MVDVVPLIPKIDAMFVFLLIAATDSVIASDVPFFLASIVF